MNDVNPGTPFYHLDGSALIARADQAELERIAALEAGDENTAKVCLRRRELYRARLKVLDRAGAENATREAAHRAPPAAETARAQGQ